MTDVDHLMAATPPAIPNGGLSADIIVVGAGAVGLVAALAFARDGYRVILGGDIAPRRDGRTVALLDGSISLLRRLGVWDAIAPYAAPLATMRLIDDTGALFRAPPVSFSAAEIGLPAFGQNVENAELVRLLGEAVTAQGAITAILGPVHTVSPRGACVSLAMGDGRLASAALVVAADGRRSEARDAAGLRMRDWRYPQVALTTILAHSRDHDETSTEFHTREGAFTFVPLPGRRSSLVWMMSEANGARRAALDDAALAAEIEDRSHGILGDIRIDGPRGVTPMGGLAVSSYAARRIAVVGEAAHVFPPIGAQGLNLGLRDVAALRDAVVEADDPGSDTVLRRYDRGRRLDVGIRTAGVDLLNRSLLTGLAPVDAARGFGLMLLDQIGPLRRAVMRQGLASREPTTPTLMREIAGTA